MSKGTIFDPDDVLGQKLTQLETDTRNNRMVKEGLHTWWTLREILDAGFTLEEFGPVEQSWVRGVGGITVPVYRVGELLAERAWDGKRRLGG